MAKTAAEIAKDLVNHGGMKIWKQDEKGIHLVDRKTDNVTTGGITVGTDCKIGKTK